MGYLEISFVLIMLLAGLWVVLIVRRDFLDRGISARDERERIEREDRKKRALSRSYQSGSGR
ncbi:MAG: hypothetical protein ACR2LZ_10460 [Pyrinomonadaceae bacterium]